MRLTIAALLTLIAASNGSANWGWGHGWGWYPPVYHYPMVYAYPVYVYPMCCECPPPMMVAPAPAPAWPSTPPARMPDKTPPKTGAATPETVPYAPIQPASGTSEERIPKTEVPLPKVEVPPVRKDEPKPPAASGGIELPSIAPTTPKIELPPLPVPTTSKFRPVSVSSAPLAGQAKDGKFSVVFMNYSDRDIELMVDGARISLPPKHTTTATVSRNYRMSIDDGDVEFKAIGETDKGVEVTLK